MNGWTETDGQSSQTNRRTDVQIETDGQSDRDGQTYRWQFGNEHLFWHELE